MNLLRNSVLDRSLDYLNVLPLLYNEKLDPKSYSFGANWPNLEFHYCQCRNTPIILNAAFLNRKLTPMALFVLDLLDLDFKWLSECLQILSRRPTPAVEKSLIVISETCAVCLLFTAKSFDSCVIEKLGNKAVNEVYVKNDGVIIILVLNSGEKKLLMRARRTC